MTDTDVIIIGGGPTGLALALALDLQGVRSVLFEREAESRLYPKGNSLNARTMEIFRRLGVADEVRALGLPADHPFDIAYFTRFSAFEIARARQPSRLEVLARRETLPPTHQVCEPRHKANQMYVERFLTERARTRPNIELRFGETVEAVAQDADTASADSVGPDGARRTVRARYLVGCDGSRSLVRRTLGIKYGGQENLTDVFLTGLITSVHMRIPSLYPTYVGHRRAWAYYAMNGEMQLIMFTLDGGEEFMMHIPTKAGEAMDVPAAIRRVKAAIGVDVEVKILSHRQWNGGAYLVADRYQEGRFFLAGDAAHLYTPSGGFGLNTGVDDAANLAWKFAAVLKGWGGQALLDSYETERRAAALRNTGIARAIGKATPYSKIDPAIEEDSPAGQAARDAVARSDFIVHNHFNEPEETDWLGVILGSRYDEADVVMADAPPPPESAEAYVPSDVPGGRAPHLWLDSGRGPGSSLYDHLGDGLTLLSIGDQPDVDRFAAAATATGTPLTVFTVPADLAGAFYTRRFYLVRPDGWIAWRGDAAPADAAAVFSRITGRGATAKAGRARDATLVG